MRLRTLAVAVSLAAASPMHAQSDSAQVMSALDRFFGALRTKDTLVLRAAFDSAARFTLLRPDPAGGVRAMILTPEQFIRSAAGPNSAGIDEPIRNARVMIDQDLASVWAEYQVRVSGAVSHCGYDAFHLVRRGATWKILTIADSFRRQGCGPLWP